MLVSQLDEPDRILVAERERLLAVNVLPGRECSRGGLEVAEARSG